MGIRKHAPEQIVAKLREAEVLLAQGEMATKVTSKLIGISFKKSGMGSGLTFCGFCSVGQKARPASHSAG